MQAPENTPAVVNEPAPRRQRRTHSEAFKRQLIEMVNQGERSLADIAMSHQINANLLRRWIKAHEAPTTASVLAPVRVQAPCDGVIDIDVSATTVRISGAADPALINTIIKGLR